MVRRMRRDRVLHAQLSVLALSSRFDGPTRPVSDDDIGSALSVLALSSRFDGPQSGYRSRQDEMYFQYSLCRVVLMVSV